MAYITILTNRDTANFAQVGSIASILGFPALAIVAPSAGYTQYGTTQAALNRNNTYLISSSLISGGIPTNSSAQGLVPISAVPGSQINWSAQNVLWTPATELVGQRKSNFSFRLTNELGAATPTAGESRSFTLTIRYRR